MKSKISKGDNVSDELITNRMLYEGQVVQHSATEELQRKYDCLRDEFNSLRDFVEMHIDGSD